MTSNEQIDNYACRMNGPPENKNEKKLPVNESWNHSKKIYFLNLTTCEPGTMRLSDLYQR